MGKEREKWMGDRFLGKKRERCLVLDYYSSGSLGKRTKLVGRMRRVGERRYWGRQREEEERADSRGTMRGRPRGEW